MRPQGSPKVRSDTSAKGPVDLRRAGCCIRLFAREERRAISGVIEIQERTKDLSTGIGFEQFTYRAPTV